MKITTTETIGQAISLMGDHLAISMELAASAAKKALNDAQEALKNAEQ